MTNGGKVYAGVVTFNSLDDIGPCMQSVHEQVGVEMRILVLDNDSRDGTVSWLRSQDDIARLILNERNLGFGGGHNRLIAMLEMEPGDFYLSLNPDVRLEPRYVVELRRALLEENAGWGIGKLRLMDSFGIDSGLLYSVGHALLRNGYAFNIGYGMTDNGQFNERREVFGAAGAAALLSAPFVESIRDTDGLYDPRIFLYGEDTDLDWRAHHAGWHCVYEPRAAALHRGSTPSQELEAQAIANRYLSVVKNAFWVDLILFNLPIILGHMLLRLILTPRLGLTVLRTFLPNVSHAWRSRPKRTLARKQFHGWFRWSAMQPSNQPKTLVDRAWSLARRLS